MPDVEVEKVAEDLFWGEPSDRPGYFIPITIIDNPPESRRIVHEEQFGTVLPLLKFDDPNEAIARANATDYGWGLGLGSG